MFILDLMFKIAGLMIVGMFYMFYYACFFCLKLIIFPIECILNAMSCDNTSDDPKLEVKRQEKPKDNRISGREMRRIRKARRQAEMDAFEDAYMYYEVFMDD